MILNVIPDIQKADSGYTTTRRAFRFSILSKNQSVSQLTEKIKWLHYPIPINLSHFQ